MKITKYLTALAAACSLLCLATPASAVIVNVIGNANPWNALSSTGDGALPPSIATSGGSTVTWSTTGAVDIGLGLVTTADGSLPTVSHGAQNGVTALLNKNQGALVGVWSTGLAFIMGASGSAVAPAGATALFMGIMDSDTPVPSWNNNTGSFNVNVNSSAPSGVPDFGSTLVLMLVGIGLVFVYRKQVLA